MNYLGEGVQGLLVHALRRPCVLCGAEAAVASVYQATGEAAERLGAPPGQTRLVFYSLCDAHPLDTGTAERAGRALEAFLAVSPPTMVPVEALNEEVALFEADP